MPSNPASLLATACALALAGAGAAPVLSAPAAPAPAAAESAGTATNTDELAVLRAKYEEALRRTDEKRDQSAADLGRQYERLLASREGECQARGDLDATLAVQRERTRFANEKTVPSAAGDSPHAEVAALRARYGKAFQDLALQRLREVVRVTDSHTNQLSSLRVALTRQGRLDDAKAVNLELDFTVTSQSFLEARSLTGAAEPAPRPTPPPPDPTRTTKTIKIVDPKGTLSDTWTSVPVHLKEGDVVTIEASGAWTAPDVSPSCGPSGHVYAGRGASSAAPYPRYPHVQRPYMDLPYAALILRVGRAGRIRPVGERLVFTNDAPGMVAFDINARQDRKYRAGCNGSMKVTVEVRRGAGPDR